MQRAAAAFDDGGESRQVGDAASPNGKILRLNADGTTPDDQAGASPIYAAGSSSPIETPGGELPAGENESYQAAPEAPLPLNLSLEEGIRRYVDWLTKRYAS